MDGSQILTTLSEPPHSGSSYIVQGLIPVMNSAFYIYFKFKRDFTRRNIIQYF